MGNRGLSKFRDVGHDMASVANHQIAQETDARLGTAEGV